MLVISAASSLWRWSVVDPGLVVVRRSTCEGKSQHVAVRSRGHCLPLGDGAMAETAGKLWGTDWWCDTKRRSAWWWFLLHAWLR